MKPVVLTVWLLASLTQRAFAQVDGEVLPGDRVPASASPQGSEPLPAASPNDLEQAADATAEVAAIPQSDAQPYASASRSDIDLGMLGLDPGSAAFDDKLTLYGFADIGYSAMHWARDPIYFAQTTRSFSVGNLNVYLAKNLTREARMLVEVRFTFLPNGTLNADGSYVSTEADDLASADRKIQWGGIIVERAYLEYDATAFLTIRAGRWLTPYGIWNIDHGSPVIVGIYRPYIIGEQFFPEHQTGLDLFGSRDIAGFRLDYHATASNGRGATEAVADQDTDLAFGARLELETPWGLKLGGSGYRGRYTGLPATAGALAETYQEAAYGGDVQFDYRGLHVQGEVIARERHYAAGQRALSTTGFVPDSRALGAYVLAGYRFDRLWNVMPFAGLETYRPIDASVMGGDIVNAGLNFRPTGSLVFKLQGTHVKFHEGMSVLAGYQFSVYGAQASWAF